MSFDRIMHTHSHTHTHTHAHIHTHTHTRIHTHTHTRTHTHTHIHTHTHTYIHAHTLVLAPHVLQICVQDDRRSFAHACRCTHDSILHKLSSLKLDLTKHDTVEAAVEVIEHYPRGKVMLCWIASELPTFEQLSVPRMICCYL